MSSFSIKEDVRLYPPLRFATVEIGVHRGAFPTLRNFRFLRRLRLRTVVSLTPEGPTLDLEDWCEAEEVQMIHHQTTPSTEPFNLSLSTVASVLSVLIDPAHHPVYIHCIDGIEITGVIIMCLRKLQNWGLQSILAEHSRYLHGVQIPDSVERFVTVEFGKGGATPAGAGGTTGGVGNISVGAGNGNNMGESDELAVVVGERVPEWLWGGNRSPMIQLLNLSSNLSGPSTNIEKASAFRSHSSIRLRYNPPLYEATSIGNHSNKDHNDGIPLSINEKIPSAVTSCMMIGDGLKIGRSNNRVSATSEIAGGRGSREGSDDGASDTSDLMDDSDTLNDHSQQFIIDFSKPLADQELNSSKATQAGRSNQMALSRSLRALDLEGLEKNLTERRISAHWDLVNSPW